MTLNSELAKLESNLSDCYTSCSNKGATIPQNQNFDNLSTCIDSITTGGGGSDPIGDIYKGSIDANGNYTSAYNLTYNGNISFNGIKTVSTAGSFASYFYHENSSSAAQRLRCRSINGSVSFPDLESVTGDYSFNSFCNGQSLITSISFPKLETIGVDSNSSAIFAYAFQGCSSLTTVTFPALKNIIGKGTANGCFYTAFKNCTSLTSLSFPALLSTNASIAVKGMDSMLRLVTGCTVHFPSNLQSVIGSSTILTGGFGGTNTTVLFDLPATT